jgi:hypothetical protein
VKTLQCGLEFDNFKPLLLASGIFKGSSLLNGSLFFFFWSDDLLGFVKEGIKA